MKMGSIINHSTVDVADQRNGGKGIEDLKTSIKDNGEKEAYVLLKENLYEYLNTATAHGLGKIANASSWYTRLLWTLVVICFLAYLGQAVHKLHLKLTKYDVKVTVKTNKVNALVLPAITICDAGPKRLDQLSTNGTGGNRTLKTPLEADRAHKLRMFAMKDKLNSSQEPNHFVLRDESGTMPFCHFSGDLCSYDKHFKVLPTIKKGHCFTFNHDGKSRQVLKGPEMGIFAVFYLKNEQNFTKSVAGTATHGIEIFIHDPKWKNPTHSGGILGVPGHLTRIMLSQTFYKRLPDPFPDKCVDVNENGEGLHECQIKCIAQHQKRNCNVISLYLQEYLHQIEAEEWTGNSSVPVPQTSDDHKCVARVTESYANEDLTCDCFLPCEENTYDQSVSTSPWPPGQNIDELLQLIKDKFGIIIKKENVDKELAAIQVYYGKLGYTKIHQTPAYSIDEFTYDLGGLLGLIIGASVFSSLELGLFLLFAVKEQLRKLINRGKKR